MGYADPQKRSAGMICIPMGSDVKKMFFALFFFIIIIIFYQSLKKKVLSIYINMKYLIYSLLRTYESEM